MKRIQLRQIAHARSGDKGDSSNVGLLANSREAYEIIKKEVTVQRVKQHFKGMVNGNVEVYPLPNLLGLNFILRDSLGGGGSESLRNDAQGKTHGQALLLMEIEVPDDFEVDENLQVS
ncbi:MAG: hypothetical protein ACE5HS_20540 [bacterium]